MFRFLKSFVFAFSGIFQLLKTERNFKIQLLALVIVIVAGIYFNISKFEWIAVLSISALVLSLEALNSSIEKLCDLYTEEQNPKIKIIKDIAAGSVLIAAIFAVAIAVVILENYFFE